MFKSKQSLTGHFNAKHTDKFKCEVCAKSFESGSKLKRHCISHNKSKDLVCEVCGKLFGRQDNLQKHRKTNH